MSTVVIEIKDGFAYVSQKPKGVRVVIEELDLHGADRDACRRICEADELIENGRF